MEDKLCLIPYSEIEFDKTYTNISEYFLRGNRAVELFLAANGAEERAVLGRCSDFELLSAFVKINAEKSGEKASVQNTFDRVINDLIGENSPLSMGAEELWIRTSNALIEKKLRERVAVSNAKKLGVPLLPNEFFDDHFVSIKGVKLNPVFCPFGIQGVSIDTFGDVSLAEIEDIIVAQTSEAVASALFFVDFKFEKPNEYSASKAYEKYRTCRTLLNKEKAVLGSQLLRIAALSAAEVGKELLIFLPFAPNVSEMGAAAEMLEYIDESLLSRKLNVSVFGGDAVSLCMAQAIAGKRYKNITAVTGICGNGSDRPDISSAVYWGCGEKVIRNYASLSKTPALLGTK